MLIQKVENLVTIKVNVVGTVVLEELLIFERGHVGEILSITGLPLFLLHVNFVSIVEVERAKVKAECSHS